MLRERSGKRALQVDRNVRPTKPRHAGIFCLESSARQRENQLLSRGNPVHFLPGTEGLTLPRAVSSEEATDVPLLRPPVWVHPDRVTRRHCHHRHLDWPPAAGRDRKSTRLNSSHL